MKLKYVDEIADRHGGQPFFYFRHRGKRIRLRGEAGSSEFVAHYEQLLAAVKDQDDIQAARQKPKLNALRSSGFHYFFYFQGKVIPARGQPSSPEFLRQHRDLVAAAKLSGDPKPKIMRKNGFSETEIPAARASKKDHCEACGIKDPLLALHAHHVDGDQRNNDPSNIQTLCAFCHQFWHATYKRIGMAPFIRMPVLYPNAEEVEQSLDPDFVRCLDREQPKRLNRIEQALGICQSSKV